LLQKLERGEIVRVSLKQTEKWLRELSKQKKAIEEVHIFYDKQGRTQYIFTLLKDNPEPEPRPKHKRRCPNCNSIDIEWFVTVPERSRDTLVGKCRRCNKILKWGDMHIGGSIFD
jgi:hypothetical protein